MMPSSSRTTTVCNASKSLVRTALLHQLIVHLNMAVAGGESYKSLLFSSIPLNFTEMLAQRQLRELVTTLERTWAAMSPMPTGSSFDEASVRAQLDEFVRDVEGARTQLQTLSDLVDAAREVANLYRPPTPCADNEPLSPAREPVQMQPQPHPPVQPPIQPQPTEQPQPRPPTFTLPVRAPPTLKRSRDEDEDTQGRDAVKRSRDHQPQEQEPDDDGSSDESADHSPKPPTFTLPAVIHQHAELEAPTKPAELSTVVKPRDQKPSDQKPRDQKPSDQKPSDQKPSDQKPSEPPAVVNPAEQKLREQKPSKIIDPKIIDPKIIDPKIIDPKIVGLKTGAKPVSAKDVLAHTLNKLGVGDEVVYPWGHEVIKVKATRVDHGVLPGPSIQPLMPASDQLIVSKTETKLTTKPKTETTPNPNPKPKPKQSIKSKPDPELAKMRSSLERQSVKNALFAQHFVLDRNGHYVIQYTQDSRPVFLEKTSTALNAWGMCGSRLKKIGHVDGPVFNADELVQDLCAYNEHLKTVFPAQ